MVDMQPGFAYGRDHGLVSYELLTYPLLQLDCLPPVYTTKRQRTPWQSGASRLCPVDEQQVINKGAQVKWRSD